MQQEEVEVLLEDLKGYGLPVQEWKRWPKEDQLSQLLKEQQHFYGNIKNEILLSAEDHVRKHSANHSSKEVMEGWYSHASVYIEDITKGHIIRAWKVSDENPHPKDPSWARRIHLMSHPGLTDENYQRLKPTSVEMLAFYLNGWNLYIDPIDRHIPWGN
jgi:hypothetical protein